MKRFILLLIIFTFTSASAEAQFRIKVPKIKKPKVNKPKPIPKPNPTQDSNPAKEVSETNTSLATTSTPSNRQMVMDDAYTFFDAEPVEEYDSQVRLNKDVGWYLKSDLRIFGTVPKRSAFRVVVKQNGKSLAETRCEGLVYQKAIDVSLKTPIQRRDKDLNFDDFMYSQRCQNEESVIKPTGKMDVEIYFIGGDTDAEKLVRTYKIDVHRAPRVRGSAVKPQPDVAHYYVQRHAESAVAFLHVTGNHSGDNRSGERSYFYNTPATSSTPSYGQLVAYFSYAPARSTKHNSSPFARCSVNGQRIKLDRDSVSMSRVGRQEYAVYTDRIAQQYKRGSAYRDDMVFRIYSASLPLYSGEGKYSKPPMKIEDYPGKWECQIISNGVKLRTLSWEVGNDGKIVPHAEQQSGNINLYHKTYLVDMDIPKGGAPFDYRLMPMPNAGLFYGIPWTSAEGKQMAAEVPKVGKPFHVPSTEAN